MSTKYERLWDAGYGAIGGAILCALIGFNWGGWHKQSTVDKISAEKASQAVVAVLAPLCVDSFLKATNANEQKAEMMKASAWNRGTFIEKGGWATLPGTKAPNSPVAQACAELLSK